MLVSILIESYDLPGKNTMFEGRHVIISILRQFYLRSLS